MTDEENTVTKDFKRYNIAGLRRANRKAPTTDQPFLFTVGAFCERPQNLPHQRKVSQQVTEGEISQFTSAVEGASPYIMSIDLIVGNGFIHSVK